jgi:putative ABC transport system substrate-binding protein
VERREFLGVLGGAIAAWPLAARAQQAAMPVIGFMSGRSTADSGYLAEAFRQGLRDTGYVDQATFHGTGLSCLCGVRLE